MKNFIIVLLSSILSAIAGACATVIGIAYYEATGTPVLKNMGSATENYAYERGRKDGIKQAKEEIMTNLRAE